MSDDSPQIQIAGAEDAPAPEPSIPRRIMDGMLERWVPQDQLDGFNWQQDSHRAYIAQQPLRAQRMLYVLGVAVFVLVIWSALATIDEVTRGTGKVIPSQKVQLIQSQDGGKVMEILVQEGAIVEQGQLLVRLDQTRTLADQLAVQSELNALDVKAGRLRSVVDGEVFNPTSEWREAVPDIVIQEEALYQSDLARLGNEKSIVEEQLIQRQNELSEADARRRQSFRSLELTQRELEVTQPMVSSGAVSEVELLRLEREVNQLRGEHEQAEAAIARLQSAIQEAEKKVQNAELEFYTLIREELTATISQANRLRESLTGVSDRTADTSVRSPVRGTVKQMFVNTIGGVVLAGREIAEIVPLDDTLLLEARINPKDIAFLVPGQEAMVKFTAYDFVVYGGLEGVVEQIGADTIMDEEGEPYYTAKVRTLESSLGEDKPIIPGMTVEIDILTGKKSILAYLLKPVLRAKQYALTER